MGSFNKKPEYLSWVKDSNFRKHRQKLASTLYGRMSADTRREILLTEGIEGIDERKRSVAIEHHVFINGEYPRYLREVDRQGYIVENYFEISPFFCHEFWNDYYRYKLEGLDPVKHHYFEGKVYDCFELQSVNTWCDTQKVEVFDYHHGKKYSDIRRIAGYKFRRGGFVNGSGSDKDNAFIMFRNWLELLLPIMQGRRRIESVQVLRMNYLSTVIPFIEDSINEVLSYEIAAAAIGRVRVMYCLVNPEQDIDRSLKNWNDLPQKERKKRVKPRTAEEVMAEPGYLETQNKILDIMDNGVLPEHIKLAWEMCREKGANVTKIDKLIESKTWARKYAHFGNKLTVEEMKRIRMERDRERAIQHKNYLAGKVEQPGRWPSGADWVAYMQRKHGRFYPDD